MRLPLLLTSVIAVISPAYADDVQVSDFEYLDVIETSDGSIWKGVIVEQVPGERYRLVMSDGSVRVVAAGDVVKLSKERNPNHRRGSGAASSGGSSSATSASSLPPPMAVSGRRFGGELNIVFPTGDFSNGGINTSVAPAIRMGYESLMGNFGISGGFHMRYTWFSIENRPDGAALWLLEPHAYVRGALHMGRVAPYLGGTLGLNVAYLGLPDTSTTFTEVGFGVNLDGGVDIMVQPNASIGLGFTYHPGTSDVPESEFGMSYFALRAGATMNF